MNIKISPTTRNKERAVAIERKSQKNDKYNAVLKDELALLKPAMNGKAVKRIAVI